MQEVGPASASTLLIYGLLTLLTLHILVLPLRHVITGLPGPHGEEVSHHGAEAGGEAGLGDEAKLELGQADHVVTLLPVPRGDVQQVRLHQWRVEMIRAVKEPSQCFIIVSRESPFKGILLSESLLALPLLNMHAY